MVLILVDHSLLNFVRFSEFYNDKMLQAINFIFKKSCPLIIHFEQLVGIMMKSSLMHDND